MQSKVSYWYGFIGVPDRNRTGIEAVRQCVVRHGQGGPTGRVRGLRCSTASIPVANTLTTFYLDWVLIRYHKTAGVLIRS
eukprot:gene26328-biopygen15852